MGEPGWFLQLAEDGIETEAYRRYRGLEPPAADELDAWGAFIACLHARPPDGRISVADVAAWCELAGVTDAEQRIRILHLVQALDAVFARETRSGKA